MVRGGRGTKRLYSKHPSCDLKPADYTLFRSRLGIELNGMCSAVVGRFET